MSYLYILAQTTMVVKDTNKTLIINASKFTFELANEKQGYEPSFAENINLNDLDDFLHFILKQTSGIQIQVTDDNHHASA